MGALTCLICRGPNSSGHTPMVAPGGGRDCGHCRARVAGAVAQVPRVREARLHVGNLGEFVG